MAESRAIGSYAIDRSIGMRRTTGFCYAIMLTGLLFRPQAASAQVYDLRKLNTAQMRALDRAKTVVILTGGIVEEHGPYLPAFSDGYQNEYLARKVAEAVISRPGWTVLMFPTIPLGAGGGNEVGKKEIFPPTFHVHLSTLRDVFMDLASEFGEAGFRWIFVIHGHGALSHQLALDQAADYFNDVYHGNMVHLTGIDIPSTAVRKTGLTNAEQQENGLDIHAGMNETSLLLFLRPDLVQPGYKDARPYSGKTRHDLVNVGSQDGWPGYFASPRLASAERGADIMRARGEEVSALALRILDGFDYRTLPRSSDRQLKDQSVREHKDVSDEHDRTIQGKQQEWLRRQAVK
jgi:creatinine amidohydrolase